MGGFKILMNKLCQLVGHEWDVRNNFLNSIAKCELCGLEYALWLQITLGEWYELRAVIYLGAAGLIVINREDVPSELINKMVPKASNTL